MTTKLTITTHLRRGGELIKQREEIEATYLTEKQYREKRAELGIIYSAPDYPTIGSDLIVFQDRGGSYFYITRPHRIK